jgi:tetratricopeptide (TPR) repeat protein
MRKARSNPGWAGRLLTGAFLVLIAGGAHAQGESLLDEARAAEARLDFHIAYARLETAIAAAPDAPAPYLARAGLHRKLARPALALADLERARGLAPVDPAPLVAIGDIWLENKAHSRAIRAYDEALARAPAHLPALAGRAQAHAGAGLIGNALADYDSALSLAPDDAALASERAALIEARTTQRIAAISYDPAALMAPEFRIEEGAPEAAARLVIVEAGNELAPTGEGLDPDALTAAIGEGALHLTRVFTYTGQDSAIWANLALICGGRAAYPAMSAALRGETGREAIAAIDTAGDLAPLRALVGEAYAAAGVDDARLEACAFNRGQALRYLAEWSEKHDSLAWKGVNFYDFWPVYLWNDAPITAEEVNALLLALLPAEPETPAPALRDEPEAVEPPSQSEDATPPSEQDSPPEPSQVEAGPAPEPELPLAPTPEPAEAPAMADLPGAESLPDEDAPAPARDDPDPSAPREPDLPVPVPVTAEGRVPAELRGIFAPGLVDCLAYGTRREAAAALDDILPGLNPLDGPSIGTVLLASQRLHLFNATDTECGLAALPETQSGDLWRGAFTCTNVLAPDVATPLDLVRVEGDGPAPWLEARLGAAEPVTLIQCRPFGLLGRDAAPLWGFDEADCRLRAPVSGATFAFEAGADGRLALLVSPAAPPGNATAPRLSLDGIAWGTGTATGDGAAWRFDLGPFPQASERLGLGLFLDVSGAGDGAPLRLPLLGSSAAMARLSTCAPAAQGGESP